MKSSNTRHLISTGLVLLGMFVATAAGQAPVQGPLSWEWPVSTPEKEGLDGTALASLVIGKVR